MRTTITVTQTAAATPAKNPSPPSSRPRIAFSCSPISTKASTFNTNTATSHTA